MLVNPGELNRKIKIFTTIPGGTDDDGFPTGDREDNIRTCWAKVTNQSGKNLVQANAEFTEITKRFLIRCTGKRITTDMFVRYRGLEYEICYVNNYGEADEYLELLAKARSQKPVEGGS